MGLFGSNKCAQCGVALNIRDTASNGLKVSGPRRCKICKIKVSKALRKFAHEFRLACEDGVITSEEWRSLWLKLQPSGVTHDEALSFIRTDALDFLNSLIDLTFEDGVVTAEEEVHFRRMIAILEVCPKDMTCLRVKWEKCKEQANSNAAPEAA